MFTIPLLFTRKISRISRLIRFLPTAFFIFFFDMSKPNRWLSNPFGLEKIVKYLSEYRSGLSNTNLKAAGSHNLLDLGKVFLSRTGAQD